MSKSRKLLPTRKRPHPTEVAAKILPVSLTSFKSTKFIPPKYLEDRRNGANFEVRQRLGIGGFGECWKVMNVKTKQHFACKFLPKRYLEIEKVKDQTVREVLIHSSVNHPYILKLYNYFTSKDSLVLKLELCPYQTLLDLQKRRRRLEETEVRCFLRQILLATKYMHGMKIIHRDLKLSNLLIHADLTIRICDFGLATMIQYQGERKLGVCGTTNYVAPEIILKCGHGFEADIWSIGVIMYSLLIGKCPFARRKEIEIKRAVVKANFSIPANIISKEASDLLQRIFVLNPELRIRLEDILETEFMTMYKIPAKLPSPILVSRIIWELESKTKDDEVNTDDVGVLKTPGRYASRSFLSQTNSARKGRDILRNLYIKLKRTVSTYPLKRKNVHFKTIDTPHSSLHPWIINYSDLSSTLGFGYGFSDNSLTIDLPDSSSLTLERNKKTMLFKQGIFQLSYDKDGYVPNSFRNNEKILNSFVKFHKGSLGVIGQGLVERFGATFTERAPKVYLWCPTSRCMMMVLSNGLVQFSLPREGINFSICSNLGILMDLDSNRGTKYSLSEVGKKGCSSRLFSRILFAKKSVGLILGERD